MSWTRLIAIVTILLIFAVGCDRDMMSEKGFRLPDGDAAAGREAFVYMQCHQCHTLDGEEFPVIPNEEPPYVELGGDVTKVRTYGELVTSIVNPSHKLAQGYAEEVVSDNGKSNMYLYNDYMTVQELTDLVRFLQPHYKVMTPAYPIRIHP